VRRLRPFQPAAHLIMGCLRGATAPLLISSPSLLKERGIKGVR